MKKISKKVGGEDVGAIGEKCRRVGRAFGWRHPFILPALMDVHFVPSTEVPDMDASLSGRIRVNEKWATSVPEKVLGSHVVHALLHLMLRHRFRGDGKKTEVFSRAACMATNSIEADMGLDLPPSAVLPPPGFEKASAEDIYDFLDKEEKGDGDGDGDGSAPSMCGCGVHDDMDGEGDGDGAPGDGAPGDGEGDGSGEGDGDEDGEGSGGGSEDPRGDAERRWQEVAVQANALAAGTQAGSALARVLLPPPAKVNWRQFLRSTVSRALAAHGRDDQSFTRRNRRSPPGVILPGWVATRARVAVVLDTSGSVSDELLAEMVAETTALARETGVKIFLVSHDASVQFAEWIDGTKRANVQDALRGRGGTLFSVAYDRLSEERGNFDAAAHFTDGFPCETWPARPANVRRLVAGIFGAGPPADAIPPHVESVKVSD